MTEDTYNDLYPVRLKDPEVPIQEDCASEFVPPGTTDMEGKKKVLVPELITMTKVLFDRYIVTISLMWKLPDWISKMLLESAGKTLNERDRRHRALTYILDIMWDQGVEAANQYLTSQGLPILTI